MDKISMETSNIKSLVLVLVLSLIFTFSLVHLTFELPRLIHKVLVKIIPEYPIPVGLKKLIEPLRPYGYITLIILLILSLIGFIVKKFKLTTFSSVVTQLTVFGHFAFTMFVFAGIGVVRLVWLPILEISPDLLKLGNIILIPMLVIEAIVYGLGLMGVELMKAYFYTSLITMFLGALILFMGTMTWLYGKFKGVELINFWIYKYSRHPQYLGFLIYSYGLLILAAITPAPKGGYFPLPTLPWLIAALLIIDVAILEEIELRKKLGESFEKYRKITPFMFPLPKELEFLIKLPAKLVLRKDFPRNRREVILITLIYASLLIILSIPLRHLW